MNYSVLLIFIILLICTNGFSLIGWNTTISGWLMKILALSYTAYLLLAKRFSLPNRSYIKPFVIWLMFLPFLSVISANAIHGQSLIDSVNATSYNLCYGLFFAMCFMQVNDAKLVKLCCMLGVFWCGVEIVQQFTYPNVWFALRSDGTNEVEIRNGIYRYDMVGREFGILMLFYCFDKFINEGKDMNKRYLYFFGIMTGLIGVYLLASRQTIAASLLCLAYSFFANKKVKFRGFFLIGILVFLLYVNKDLLFGEYIEKAASELKSDDYVRFLSYQFYGIDYNKGNILAIIFGNGDPYKGTSYYGEINNLEENFALWRSDIGVVGVFSVYGIVYILCMVSIFIYFYRKRKFIDLYLKSYLVYVFITSVMLWHFCHLSREVSFMCILLYLIDKSIIRNQVKLKRSGSYENTVHRIPIHILK